VSQTIFEKIIQRELPSEIVYEDDEIICIKDRYPQAPVHLLLITKKTIPSIHHLEEKDAYLVGKIFLKARELAEEFGIGENYRVLTNRGPEAGQTVFHLHFHLLGGKKLGGKGG
jgi:histidine triad (HIT) family protein